MQKKEQLKLYPNPFQDRAKIKFPNLKQNEYTLIVSDIAGKIGKIIPNIRTSVCELERGELVNGTYFVELIGSNVFKGKIVLY